MSNDFSSGMFSCKCIQTDFSSTLFSFNFKHANFTVYFALENNRTKVLDILQKNRSKSNLKNHQIT